MNEPELKDPALDHMKWYGQAGLLVVMLVIAIPHITKAQHFSFIDYVNLGFHEAGHFVLGIFSNELLTFMGGTMGQLFVPAVFFVYFLYKKEYTAVIFTAFWFFENIMNISIYMADSHYQQLPLLGGEGTVHDWVYIFGELKCITIAPALAQGLRVVSTLGMIAAIFAMAFMLMVKSPFARPRQDDTVS
jgi:hypothetical protein